MTLGKRALLVIFPVILIIQLVASTTAYLTQRASLLGLEQARLEQQPSALKSAYLDYEAFNRSVLYSIIDSEALLHFLRESDTAFATTPSGFACSKAFARCRTPNCRSFFAIVQPDGQPAYYFESSLSPFGSMDATQQRIVQQARQSASSATIYLEQADGAPLLVNTDFVLPASGSRPPPSQRGEAFAIQLAVRPERFIKLKRALRANTVRRWRSPTSSCRWT